MIGLVGPRANFSGNPALKHQTNSIQFTKNAEPVPKGRLKFLVVIDSLRLENRIRDVDAGAQCFAFRCLVGAAPFRVLHIFQGAIEDPILFFRIILLHHTTPL